LEIWGRQAQRWAPYLNRLDRAVAISRYTANAAAEGGVTVPVVVIPCCVDIEQFTPGPPSNDIRRGEILICGRMSSSEKYKGHELLFRCLPLVQERLSIPVTLRVVGSGDDLERLRGLAAELGVANRVTFTGRVPLADLVDAYRRCGVFCMPSVVERSEVDFWTGEGFGIVYIEAQACGRPVVASTDGGAPETLLPGTTGLLANPRDPVNVADSISHILGDAAFADEMGHRGREFVVRTFSRAVFQNRVNELAAALEGPAGPAVGSSS
jgi:phosphatidylinositol alpha-1,6-mannosyltransferase